ncbi:MAG: Panacea domain-containing protein [Patescibacteria group bacterium]|nr:Panacea domain-containing protein [Patescibacteria group bacterium]
MIKNFKNLSKYDKLLLLILAKSKGEIKGRKKIWKMLYFLDFDMFEYDNRSITGDVYEKYPMGPKPRNIEQKLLELEKKGFIKTEKEKSGGGYNDTCVYKLKNKSTKQEIEELESMFNKKERFIIKRDLELYGDKNGSELEKISHSEAPYNAVDLYQLMDYELSFYRDTEFV